MTSCALLALVAGMAAGCGGGTDDSAAVTADTPPAANALAENAPAANAPAADAPAVTFKPGAESTTTAKIGGPVSISYRIVGQPVVGQPLSIDLRVSSALDGQPVRLDYRILDATALQLAESQTPFATVAQRAGDPVGAEQVRVVPLREGRLYLNVAASVDTAEGSMSTVTAIPIQVGDTRRDLRENGRLATDEAGESVRVLGGEDD